MTKARAAASAATDEASASTVAPDRLRVPDDSGAEITVAVGGGEPVTLAVVDGYVTIDPDDAKLRIGNLSTLETLRRIIPGAELVEA